MTTETNETVKAQPTKAFFVEMLVKDVSLLSAIMDLLDNCVDGAKRIRGEESFDKLTVQLRVSKDLFEIKDNCGGMDPNLARDYAFMFGRPSNAPRISSSVGLFGVGMKRAIFKIGRKFEVSSTWVRSKFLVAADIAEWEADDREPWTFPMSISKFDKDTDEADRGTTVRVTEIGEAVAAQFDSQLFASRLESEIAARHQVYLERGLNIKVNRRSVVASPPQFAYVYGGSLLPAKQETSYDGVDVRLFAGVGSSDVDKAGWYVYCNGRLVVKADQSDLTGWGELGTVRIPKYHHQFSRFVGCAFFDSEDARKLPWNTTKDRLDVESALYRTVKLEMVKLMRPVIDFLNKLDEEMEQPDEEKRVLAKLLGRVAYGGAKAELPTSTVFQYVKPLPMPKQPKTVRIQYDRPIEKVELVKKHLRARSAKEAGEKTFDWYLENECNDD